MPNTTQYKPISSFTVDCMHFAGAEKIIMIHGSELKQDIVEYYHQDNFIHVTQQNVGFVQTLTEIFDHLPFGTTDILYGLPDSYYETYGINPFTLLLETEYSSTGLFTATSKEMKVDRMIDSTFHVKTDFSETPSELFWGIFKINQRDFDTVKKSKMPDIGNILNVLDIEHIDLEMNYYDIGTWQGYNEWLTSMVKK